MGTFTFKAGGDMFAFFNQGCINPGYWMEKLKHSTHNAIEHERAYSEAAFKSWMFEDFWEGSRELDQADTTQWWQELVEHVFSPDAFTDTEEDAVGAIESMDLPAALGRHYDDLHEVRENWRQNWWNMEWCMAAILAGVRTYNQHKTDESEREAQSRAEHEELWAMIDTCPNPVVRNMIRETVMSHAAKQAVGAGEPEDA